MRKLNLSLLFVLIIPLFLYSDITLIELKNAPLGHARNFQIWQFMQQDINAAEAKSAYGLTKGYNHKIYLKYAKKTDDKKILEEVRCSKLHITELLKENNATCIDKGISLKGAMKLSKAQRQVLVKKLSKQYKNKAELISLMNSKSFVLSVLKSGDKNYIKLFNTLGIKNRQKYFNVKLSEKQINSLSTQKGFNKAIKYIVTDTKMHRMQESLLLLQPSELSAESYFFLALNALSFKAVNKAVFYLEIAKKKAYFQINKDKAVFWQYLITKDFKHLKSLSEGTDLNIYTLHAKELLHVDYNNYFYTLDLKNAPSSMDLSNPYNWEKTLDLIRVSSPQELQKMLDLYNTKDDEVLYAFIYTKMLKYKEHNYILPYKDSTQDLSTDDKALLYALARQESHFIPSAISRSYALGVMQMMPFLIKALAKQRKESPSLDDMFNPNTNITYAKKHIKYLQKYLYHPLFIAYAYNGGIGFTKRHLLKGSFTKGSFEPYLSMELMSNTESREYGKKVLANYIVYKKILGEEVKLIPLLQNLTQPLKTDFFRKQALASHP